MATKIYAHNPGSRGARALATALGCRVLRHTGSRYAFKRGDVIINWGCGSAFTDGGGNVITPTYNQPASVRVASNKRSTFELLSQQRVPGLPRFTTVAAEAAEWRVGRRGNAPAVVVRRILNGHSGHGIEIVSPGGDLPTDAPLYVEYIKKTREARLHIFNGRLIAWQEKRRRREVPDADVNWQVRNHDNGFIFARDNVVTDQRAVDIAVAALAALGLDFGAVDLIFNEQGNAWYFLEVNTAPGLEGQTITDYAEAFNNAPRT